MKATTKATTKAWTLDGLAGALRFVDAAVPEPRPGSVRVKLACSALLSYQRDYVTGKLPHYSPPDGAFVMGTNGVGTIDAVGRDVWHLQPGVRVVAIRVNMLDASKAMRAIQC